MINGRPGHVQCDWPASRCRQCIDEDRRRRAPAVKLLWTLTIFVLAACRCATTTPSPVDPSPPCVGSGCEPLFPDAGPPRSEFTTACGVLEGLGCAEGARPDCAVVMQHSTSITLVPTACIAAAKSKDDVRACGGFVKCP